MIGNYLKIAVRYLFTSGRNQNSLYAWINLSGLIIGFTAFLLISHFVHYEIMYDRFYVHYKDIYRLVVERKERGEVTMQSAKTYAGVGDILKTELPEMEQFVRILDEECMFQYEPENINFNRQRTFWADGNFHEFFSLTMLAAGQLEMLYEPNQAIISRSAAERFFGAEWHSEKNPVGKTLILNGGVPFMIQGVFEDLPAFAHMNVDFVVSYSTLAALLGDYMNTVMPPQRNFVYNYLAFKKATDAKKLKPIINKIISGHTGNLDDQVGYNFSLQPITTIHLDSHLSDELNPNGNRLFVWALSIAAFLIIIVAWINFINLTMARAMNRSKEVGVRKAIGAQKGQLAIQFAMEILFSAMIAAMISVMLTFFCLGFFDNLTNINIPLFSLHSWAVWTVFIGTFLAGVVLASVYPSILLSSFNPVNSLKGKKIISIRAGRFRQGLMVFQFGIAMVLITCTMAVFYQVGKMRKQSLGMDPKHVLVIHSPRSMIGNNERVLIFNHFRDILQGNAGIVSVASGGCLPGEKFLIHTEDVRAEGIEADVNWSFDVASVDEQYLPTLGMKLSGGRNFMPRPDEENKIMLNETAVQALGFDNPASAVGRYLRINQQDPLQIVGVVEDAHFESLRENIRPMLLRYGHDYEFGFFPVRINTHEPGEIIKRIEIQWNSTYPRDPFEYFFLDNFFDRQYKGDQAFGKLFGFFAVLTIFISGLGLFGLISLITYQKSREIGIRKVFGASIFSIIKLLTTDLLKLLFLAAIISLPVAYFLIDRWLQTFAYRFEPLIWMYILPVIFLLITSFLAVGGQTIRSAIRNPVDTIADE